MATGFQRVSVYNRFLPYESEMEAVADRSWKVIMNHLEMALRGNEEDGGTLDSLAIVNALDDFCKYNYLYGMRFGKEDHLKMIRWLLELLEVEHLDLFCVEKILKVLISLLHKKFLIKREELVIEWRPLYDLLHQWDDSTLAIRGLVKIHEDHKSQLRSLIANSRAYFSDDATQEMLDLWRPKFCSFDRSIWTAFKYLSLFLPTSSSVPPEKSHRLWYDEFLNLWKTFSNGPAFEAEMFVLWSRLALHNIGRIDWSDAVEPFFTRIMSALELPVSYAGSGLRLSYGLQGTTACLTAAARWIVSAMHGGGKAGDDPVQKHLDKLLLSIESYFHPANMNTATDSIHSFVSLLCSCFVRRIHVERYNKKWETRIPVERRLTDEDIAHFVKSLIPISFHILYNNVDEERRNIFNLLSTVKPDLILPELIKKVNCDVELMNTPNRFTACVSTLSGCSRPLVEHYPLEVINLLNHMVPGINVNDIYKSTDIFILISDILDMIWLVDFSNPATRSGCEMTEEEKELCVLTSSFEDFVLNFIDRCLTLVENSSREQIRQESDNMDETMNEEEIAADCTISDTFQKMLCRCSQPIFQLAFDKLKRYVTSRILEPAVSGSIMSGMCKACAVVRPEASFKFFIPALCQRIESILTERVDNNKADHELQFVFKMLSEVVSVRGTSLTAKVGSNPLLPYISMICDRVLDKSLDLPQKDEYEAAGSILNNILHNLVHVRQVTVFPAMKADLKWSREEFQWAKSGDLDKLKVEWYIPTSRECSAAEGLVMKYMSRPLETLKKFSTGKLETLSKEESLRNLTLINKITWGVSELLPGIIDSAKMDLFTELKFMDSLYIHIDGKNIRKMVLDVFHDVQIRLLKDYPDYTESLNTLISGYDILVSYFGSDEDDLHDHIDDHRTIKSLRENKMVKSKRHLDVILYDRIFLQHAQHLLLRNYLSIKTLPMQLLEDVFQLSVSHYSEVRTVAQALLGKILVKSAPDSQLHLTDRLVACLKDSKDVSHEELKGALYILSDERLGFLSGWNWKLLAKIMPVLVQAQHSDKDSIVDLMKDFAIRCNRAYAEAILFSMPIRRAVPTEKLRSLMGMAAKSGNEVVPINPDYLQLEDEICGLIASGTLHWRHRQMAVGILYSLTLPGRVPPERLIKIWMDCLIHDDRTTRIVAFQAVECILKASRLKRKCVWVDSPETTNKDFKKPGIREDNLWLQYNPDMTSEDLEKYWDKPFMTKMGTGFYAWPVGKTKMRVVEDTPNRIPVHLKTIIFDFFNTEEKLDKFIRLVTMEHKKGEDFFSMDRAYFYATHFDLFGVELIEKFLPHLKKLVNSDQESDQRAAAEIMYGIIRGSRFWSFKDWNFMQKEMTSLMKNVLDNLTAETIGDWEAMINAATSKADPNRIRWLLNLLVDECDLIGKTGAFKEACILRLLNKALSLNWKCRHFHKNMFKFLIANCDHPYQKVRHQIAKLLAVNLTFDITWYDPTDGPRKWSVSEGFPTKKEFIEHLSPKLNLNHHNPELEGMVSNNGQSEDTGGGASGIFIQNHLLSSPSPVKIFNTSMEVDSEGGSPEQLMAAVSSLVSKSAQSSPSPATLLQAVAHKATNSSPKGLMNTLKALLPYEAADSRSKEECSSPDLSNGGAGSANNSSTNILETVGVWLIQFIQSSSSTITKDVYQLLPFLCQFIGTEKDEEVSQACLKSLCFLSVCTVTPQVIPEVMDMSWKVMQSKSWKAKLSILEFVQVFVFNNFMSLCLHEEWVSRIEKIVVELLLDENANVQQRASKVLGGLIHSHFLDYDCQVRLLKEFRSRLFKVKRPNRREGENGNSDGEPPQKRRRKTRSSAKSAAKVSAAANTSDPAHLFKNLANDKTALSHFHSGILGLCALVEAYPYDIPSFMPEILIELETHLHDPQPIPKTIKKTFQEFKRTHQDNWAEHKLKFTEDQLSVMTDLLVSPNYYA